ncbi:hypothetical protein FACS1894120_5140 [Clostridia bacterium]|nr:hypothetical protein FACS1894120_5140 [Clostridia bacterium]
MNERVKELRNAQGLSQSAFANMLGIKNAAISDIERKKNNLTEANILAICYKFNVNENWLRTGEGEMYNKNKLEQEAYPIEWSTAQINIYEMMINARREEISAMEKYIEHLKEVAVSTVDNGENP